MSKLYLVTHTIENYVLADSEYDAIDQAENAVRDAFLDECAEAIEVRHGDPLANMWEDRSLVYHAGREDIRLDSVWPEKPAPPAQGEQQMIFSTEKGQ